MRRYTLLRVRGRRLGFRSVQPRNSPCLPWGPVCHFSRRYLPVCHDVVPPEVPSAVLGSWAPTPVSGPNRCVVGVGRDFRSGSPRGPLETGRDLRHKGGREGYRSTGRGVDRADGRVEGMEGAGGRGTGCRGGSDQSGKLVERRQTLPWSFLSLPRPSSSSSDGSPTTVPARPSAL